MGTNGYPPAADSVLTEQRSCRSAVAGVRTPVHFCQGAEELAFGRCWPSGRLFGLIALRMRLVSVLTKNRIEGCLADRAEPSPFTTPLTTALFSGKLPLTRDFVTFAETLPGRWQLPVSAPGTAASVRRQSSALASASSSRSSFPR